MREREREKASESERDNARERKRERKKQREGGRAREREGGLHRRRCACGEMCGNVQCVKELLKIQGVPFDRVY